MRIVLLAVAFLAFRPSHADACSGPYSSVFERFDRATRVVHARVAGRSNRGTKLSVIGSIKGTGPAQVVIADAPCNPQFRNTGVAFLGANGIVGSIDGFPAASADLIAALTRWGTSKTAADRASVLVDVIATSKDAILVQDAVMVLGHPAMLAVVTTAQRDRLVAARPIAVDVNTEVMTAADVELETVLARLGVPTNKIDPNAPASDPARIIAEDRNFEAITSTIELARLIETTTRGRAAQGAFERCERARGQRLAAGIPEPTRADLAYACRLGVNPPEEHLPAAAKSAATPAGTRIQILVDIIVASDDLRDTSARNNLVAAAAAALVDDIALVNAVTKLDRDRLVARLPRMHRTFAVPMLLARVGHADLERVIPDDFAARDAVIALAAARTFESITSAAELAKRIATAPTTTILLAAYERCERLWGRALLVEYFSHEQTLDLKYDSKPFVTACKTGTPMP